MMGRFFHVLKNHPSHIDVRKGYVNHTLVHANLQTGRTVRNASALSIPTVGLYLQETFNFMLFTAETAIAQAPPVKRR